MRTDEELYQLDSLIAQKIFGWKWQAQKGLPILGFYKWHDSKGTVREHLPSYTKDSSSAMDVLQACCRNTMVGDAIVDVFYSEELWWCGNQDFSEKAETLELAICLFAIRWFLEVDSVETSNLP